MIYQFELINPKHRQALPKWAIVLRRQGYTAWTEADGPRAYLFTNKFQHGPSFRYVRSYAG